MPVFPFMQIDAFTERPLEGNPCAVVFERDELSAATMQAVAREMNLSETAFVRGKLQRGISARRRIRSKILSPARPRAAWRLICGIMI